MSSNRVIVDRTSSQLDDLLDEAGSPILTPFEMASDPLQGFDLHHHRIGQGGTIHYGRIQYGIPYVGWYRVALDDALGVIQCCASEHVSPALIGPRSTSMYQPGTGVLVQLFRHPVGFYGVILGTVPDRISDANIIMPDWVVQGSNVGVKRDGYYHNYIEQLGDEGGTTDWSNSKPIDQLCFDWGSMAETGVGIHVDSFMAYLRVDEVCGVWFYYHDQHTVLAGIGFDWMTAASNEQHRDDEGELTIYRGESPYSWEMSGLFEPGVSNFREVSDTDVHFDKPEAKYEPTKPDQQSFHRYEEFGGYLGQGRIRQLCVPPAGVVSSDIFSLEGTSAPVGVFRESISLDGSYSLASAKSVVIAKRALIPIPKRRKLQEDAGEDADSAENGNYKAAGYFGDSEEAVEHIVKDLAVSGSNPLLLTSSAVLDMHSYLFNWKVLHPFHYHKKDFLTPEEGTEGPLKQISAPLDFGQLRSNMWMARPDPTKVKVDHRYGEVDYFELLSHISFPDDGSVIIHGGFGEEIKLVAGNIVIGCPGNVLLQPGKSVVNLAGDDYIVKAKNSIDLTSTDKDIRLKAERNLQALSGNSGVGGTLFENRAVSTEQNYPGEGGEQIEGSGIVFKAPNSIVATMAAEVYLRTGSEGIGKGPIVLDAAQGHADIRTISRDTTHYVREGRMTTSFISSSGKVRSVSEEDSTRKLVGGQLNVNGPIRVNGTIYGAGPLQLSEGHVLTPQGGPVSKLRNVDIVRQTVKEATSLLEGRARVSSQTDLKSDVSERYYLPQKIGSDDSQKQISFCLRNEEEYNTKNFLLPQSHWQSLEQQSGGGLLWAERDVKYQDQFTRQPWPGKKAWDEENSFLTLPAEAMQMYDVSVGKSKDRGSENSPYENPKYGEFKPTTPKASYKIIGG